MFPAVVTCSTDPNCMLLRHVTRHLKNLPPLASSGQFVLPSLKTKWPLSSRNLTTPSTLLPKATRHTSAKHKNNCHMIYHDNSLPLDLPPLLNVPVLPLARESSSSASNLNTSALPLKPAGLLPGKRYSGPRATDAYSGCNGKHLAAPCSSSTAATGQQKEREAGEKQP